MRERERKLRVAAFILIISYRPLFYFKLAGLKREVLLSGKEHKVALLIRIAVVEFGHHTCRDRSIVDLELVLPCKSRTEERILISVGHLAGISTCRCECFIGNCIEVCKTRCLGFLCIMRSERFSVKIVLIVNILMLSESDSLLLGIRSSCVETYYRSERIGIYGRAL